MFTWLRRHLRDNNGAANVSRMTMIAIVFVVGAILLVMTTSAFRSPINHWFETVTKDWFADNNGMFEADNRYLFAERQPNGTLKGAMYVIEGGAIMIDYPEDLRNGTDNGPHGIFVSTNIGGNGGFGTIHKDANVVISDDGRTITIDGMVFTGYLQGDPNMPDMPSWMLPW